MALLGFLLVYAVVFLALAAPALLSALGLALVVMLFALPILLLIAAWIIKLAIWVVWAAKDLTKPKPRILKWSRQLSDGSYVWSPRDYCRHMRQEEARRKAAGG